MNGRWNGPPTSNPAGKVDGSIRSSKQDQQDEYNARRAAVLAKCVEAKRISREHK